MAYLAFGFCYLCIVIIVATVIRIKQKREWKKFVNATIPLKNTITISINGKDYEYNPTENFEEFMRKITKSLDK